MDLKQLALDLASSLEWVPADGYTKDICDGAVLMTTIGGGDTPFAPYDLTVCEYCDGSFVPMHGIVKLPACQTLESAKQALVTYWTSLPLRSTLKWQAARSAAIC